MPDPLVNATNEQGAPEDDPLGPTVILPVSARARAAGESAIAAGESAAASAAEPAAPAGESTAPAGGSAVPAGGSAIPAVEPSVRAGERFVRAGEPGFPPGEQPGPASERFVPEAQSAALAGTVAAAKPPGPTLSPAGWYGKLPMLGDFASRRLPEAFIRPWDEWLQTGLAAARDAIGERWLDLYLTFPVWRFVMPAGLAGDSCWIGVLLPSVDRVGRCFPLTICEPVSRQTLESAGLAGIDAQLAPLAAAGVAALEASAVDYLEQRLAEVTPLEASANGSCATPIELEAWVARRTQRYTRGPLAPAPPRESAAWVLKDPISAALAAAAGRFVLTMLAGRVLWWSPAPGPEDSGALRLEPYPFNGSLLGDLIGSG